MAFSQLAPLAYAAAALVVVAGMLAAWALIRVRRVRATPGQAQAYECGEDPIGPAWRPIPLGFLVFAVVFLLFDAEIAFVLPWVRAESGAHAAAKSAVMLFLVLLFAGWVHAWRRGDLQWRR